MNRRAFLKGTVAAGVGLAVSAAAPAQEEGLGRYFAFCNGDHLHQALDYQMPGAVYRGGGSRRLAEE